MPNWKELLNEINAIGSPFDVIRRKYVKKLAKKTNRNVILYYSGWLQKPDLARHGVSFTLDDADKNGFMAAIHKMEKKKGLDLLLHTPGGDLAASESLVDYLRQVFGSDIRAIIPQIAMSAGTMIALSCKEILMGKHSSLGPIDPQIGDGWAAHGIIEEFKQAKDEIKADPTRIAVWRPILGKYEPTIIGECNKAIQWSNRIVENWLVSGMFAGRGDAMKCAKRVTRELGSHALTLSHSRHMSIDQMAKLGVKVTPLEKDNDLQDAVLSVHHACILTLTGTGAVKLIENHRGTTFANVAQTVAVPASAAATPQP